MSDAPPVYLALDLWMALGLDSSDFDRYYERNGWADTWAALLAEVRKTHIPVCGELTDEGEPCVLHEHAKGPHYGADDVGYGESLGDVGIVLDRASAALGWSDAITTAMSHLSANVIDEPEELAGYIEQHNAIIGLAKKRNPYEIRD